MVKLDFEKGYGRCSMVNLLIGRIALNIDKATRVCFKKEKGYGVAFINIFWNYVTHTVNLDGMVFFFSL